MPRMRLTSRIVAAGAIAMGAANAQRGAGDWMTSAFDAQRSNWVRSDAKISRETVQKPGLELSWKMKFNNTPRQLNGIMPPALLDFYIGYRGFRALGFFGGSGDRVIVVDTELARMEWEKNYSVPDATSASTPACPGGMTSAVTRPTSTAFPMLPSGRGMGRGSPAKAGVGEPYEGAVTLRNVVRPMPRPVAPAKPPGGDVPSPFAPHVQWVLALTGDGKLHSFWVSNGEEPASPAAFLPPNANAQGLIAYDNVAYVATTNGCGGAANGVWALDLATKAVTQWKSGAAGVAGTAGPAVGPDGTLYAAAGTELVALAPRTLQPGASYKSSSGEFSSSPVIFQYEGKNLIAVTTIDGRLHVLDTAALGSGPVDSSQPLTPQFQTGALASWQDPAGTRWILAPSANAVVAFKLEAHEGATKLRRVWAASGMIAPATPIIVNGVVFALSRGAQPSPNAVLYALDALTGQRLWNSGKTITSFAHSGTLAAGGSRIYVSTVDGTQYAFGFPIEH
ncbi:MAG: hypothetical protein IT161_09295 [Bryobacterales bacterium]|nr:hypothetical protein [Bryobacterales bacterium]